MSRADSLRRYYAWTVDGSQPLILVRDNQVNNLLKQINHRLRTGLTITDWLVREGFAIRLPYIPHLYPRYLGRSSSREQFDKMTLSPPKPMEGPQPDKDELKRFRERMEDAIAASKAKKKAAAANRAAKQAAQNTAMVKHLKRAQRYLGLGVILANTSKFYL